MLALGRLFLDLHFNAEDQSLTRAIDQGSDQALDALKMTTLNVMETFQMTAMFQLVETWLKTGARPEFKDQKAIGVAEAQGGVADSMGHHLEAGEDCRQADLIKIDIASRIVLVREITITIMIMIDLYLSREVEQEVEVAGLQEAGSATEGNLLQADMDQKARTGGLEEAAEYQISQEALMDHQEEEDLGMRRSGKTGLPDCQLGGF